MSGAIWSCDSCDYGDYSSCYGCDNDTWEDVHADQPGSKPQKNQLQPARNDFLRDVARFKKYLQKLLEAIPFLDKFNAPEMYEKLVVLDENIGILKNQTSNETEKDHYNLCKIMTINAIAEFAETAVNQLEKIPREFFSDRSPQIKAALERVLSAVNTMGG